MLLSLSWLKEFVPYEGTAEELASKLTMLGLEVEEITRPYQAIESIVIGYVKSCEKHPEADKLSVCLVDVGQNEELQIVCGAPNVRQGQYVPVALVGTTMPDGMEIKKAKLRNVESFGMICSERELKLAEDHSGIMVLNNVLPKEKLVAGSQFTSALNLDKEILEVSLTPNRADCLSVLGIAREVSLAYNLPLTLPKVELKTFAQNNGKELVIETDEKICPRYTGRIFENVKIGPSPTWLKYRLNVIGIRSISNVVDATNYVLMELGLPLHAFDKDAIAENTIVVTTAKGDEKHTTLDHHERSLNVGDILITDPTKILGLAGVMGGLNSEITDNTKNVFLEAAEFHPSHIRKTSKRLGISSEASYRFERGVDPNIIDLARDRCASLIQQLTNCVVLEKVASNTYSSYKAVEVPFDLAYCNELLGIEVSKDFCKKTLEGLGCRIENINQDIWAVYPPSWRSDLTREADLCEEVVRVYGVDFIPEIQPYIKKDLNLSGKNENRHPFLNRARHFMAGIGLNECICYSFVGHEDLDRLGLEKSYRVSILNPLTSEQNVLRPELAPGLFNVLKYNLSQGNTSLKLFEIAQSFISAPQTETTVHETRRMGILLTGQRHSHFPHHKHTEDLFEYVDLKGIVETFFTQFLQLPFPKMVKVDNHPYLSPAVKLVLSGSNLADAGDVVGFLGRLKPEIADYYNAKDYVWYAELNLCSLRGISAQSNISFKSLPVYPPVRRDITVIAPKSLEMGTLIAGIKGEKCPYLESVELYDLYAPSKTSLEHNLTFRLTFRAADKTLQDSEVDKEREKIAHALVKNLNVKI